MSAVPLGVDIGATKVALRVGSGLSPTDEVFYWPAAGTALDDLALLARHVRPLLASPDRPVRAVGIAVPAMCDRDGIVISWPNRPSWTGLDLGSALRSIVGEVPLTWADDGELAALAEAAAAGRDNVLYLGVGTGVGGSIVLDGRPWPGRYRGACELGHMVVQLGGPRCSCGRRGCVQGIASGSATLGRLAARRGRTVLPDELASAVRLGRPWAVEALLESARALAAIVVGVRELVELQLVIVGGGFAEGQPRLVQAIAAEVAAAARAGVPMPPVYAATLGGLSSLQGAVLAANEVANRNSVVSGSVETIDFGSEGVALPSGPSSGKPQTRRYSQEAKTAAVRMISTLRIALGLEHVTVKRFTKQLGFGTESLRLWVRQAEIGDGHRSGGTTDEVGRVRELEQEARDGLNGRALRKRWEQSRNRQHGQSPPML